MALHEESLIDHRFGHVINHDVAGYHIATHADIANIEAAWLDEPDPHSNPMGSHGAGEVGIVGAAAAIANAVHHTTGIRIRNLPITPDKLLHYPHQRPHGRASGVESPPVTASKAEGQRVVLARRNKFNTMVPFHWSDEAPSGLNDLEWAEELGAKWEGDELVTYDYPSFTGLLEYYEKGEFLPDND